VAILVRQFEALRESGHARLVEIEHRTEAKDRIGGNEELLALDLDELFETVEAARLRQHHSENARRRHLAIGSARFVGARDLEQFVAHALAGKLLEAIALFR